MNIDRVEEGGSLVLHFSAKEISSLCALIQFAEDRKKEYETAENQELLKAWTTIREQILRKVPLSFTPQSSSSQVTPSPTKILDDNSND